MDNWTVYMLICPRNNIDTVYVGATNRWLDRWEAHKGGYGAKYTRANPPSEGRPIKTGLTKSEALQLEYKLKCMSSKEKLELFRSAI